jgi:hypothetical protein
MSQDHTHDSESVGYTPVIWFTGRRTDLIKSYLPLPSTWDWPTCALSFHIDGNSRGIQRILPCAIHEDSGAKDGVIVQLLTYCCWHFICCMCAWNWISGLNGKTRVVDETDVKLLLYSIFIQQNHNINYLSLLIIIDKTEKFIEVVVTYLLTYLLHGAESFLRS